MTQDELTRIFSSGAYNALRLATRRARQSESETLEPEHVVWGILEERVNDTLLVLHLLKIHTNEVQEIKALLSPQSTAESNSTEVKMAEDTVSLIKLALGEAHQREPHNRHVKIRTIDLLIAYARLVLEGKVRGTNLLAAFPVLTPEKLRITFRQVLQLEPEQINPILDNP